MLILGLCVVQRCSITHHVHVVAVARRLQQRGQGYLILIQQNHASPSSSTAHDSVLATYKMSHFGNLKQTKQANL